MYISKFSAFNFRSLKQVFVRLENGKNVIVGKNNSGKSNIIKGIEVLIGEKFPTYVNFTDNDYYTYEHIDTETGEITEVISDNLARPDVNWWQALTSQKKTISATYESPILRLCVRQDSVVPSK